MKINKSNENQLELMVMDGNDPRGDLLLLYYYLNRTTIARNISAEISVQ